MKENMKFNINENEFEKVAMRASILTIVWNIALAVFKFVAGIIASSSAVVSDAIHSASDVFSTVVVMIGVKLSAKESDKEHPYGHERLECVSAIVLAMVLFGTGIVIGYDAFMNIIKGNYNELKVPGILALIAAVTSIIVKEVMFWYTRFYAKRIESGALMADAWHHRSDAMSSVGALIGILGARYGYPIMDSIASLVIFIFIAKAAFDIFMDAIKKMTDHCCDDETEKAIYDLVMKNKEVIHVDLLQTRLFGNKIYVDIEICVNGSYTLNKAHMIAEEVHDSIEKEFHKIKHIMVHVNPAEEEEIKERKDMYKVAIFDLDGTLTDTLESMAVAGNKTLEYVGLEPRDINEYKYFAGDGADTLVRRFLMASGDKDCDKFDEAFEAYMKRFATDCTYNVKLYEGIKDMIIGLKEKGIKLAVLSNKPHLNAIKVIETFFEENTFDIVMGHKEGVNKKPNPEGALLITKELGVNPKECIYVGDTDVDMKTGKGAGMYTVGVLWGFREEDELKQNGADIIIDNPKKLLELV